jgi:hypothetical protein
MRRLALILVVASGLGWGCAHKEIRENNWQAYEPPGGWANYKPPKRDFVPTPTSSTGGQTQLMAQPPTPGSLSIAPLTGH